MARSDEKVVIRWRPAAKPKLSWAATARAMALEKEAWNDWDVVDGDGLPRRRPM